MVSFHKMVAQRGQNQAGIAIGPILFIIAILAILAAAIAAGSGSFTAPTAGESAKTKASGIIQVGDSLKIGMDRLTIENGATPPGTGSTAFDLDTTDTTGQYALFSPTGGGTAPPSASLAAAPSSDSWQFYSGSWPGLGTAGAKDYFAVLNVSSDVCNEINNKAGIATGISTDILNNDIFGSGALPAGSGNIPANIATIGNVANELSGHTLGCFGSKGNNTYYFYEILYIQ